MNIRVNHSMLVVGWLLEFSLCLSCLMFDIFWQFERDCDFILLTPLVVFAIVDFSHSHPFPLQYLSNM